MPPDIPLPLPPAAAPSSFSSTPSAPSSRPPPHPSLRPHLLLLCILPFLLLSPLAAAISCVSPTDTSTAVQPGENLILVWRVSDLDKLIFDTLSADLYCMDADGPDTGVWRSVQTLFTGMQIQPPAGQYAFRLPDCGPEATTGSIQLLAQGSSFLGYDFEQDKCDFAIKAPMLEPQLLPPQPFMPPIDPSPSSSESPPSPTPSTKSSGVARIPRIGTPTTTTTHTPTTTIQPIAPLVPTQPSISSTDTSTEAVTIGSPTTTAVSSAIYSPNPDSTTLSPSTTTSTSAPGSGDGSGGSSQSSSVFHGDTSPVTTSMPLPQPNGDSSLSGSEDGTVRRRVRTLWATICSALILICLAAVVASLVISRRRRRICGFAGATRSKKAFPRSRSSEGIMKETKRRLRLGRKPKEGYFYQMEDDGDDDDDVETTTTTTTTRLDEKALGILPAGISTGTESYTDLETARESRGGLTSKWSNNARAAADMDVAQIAVPPHAHFETPILPPQTRMASSPFTDSYGGTNSMTSTRSNFETSSVVRKYWAAAMQARAERLLQEYPPLSSSSAAARNLEEGFDAGSINSSSGRDSESRMADILSLRTAGSGASMADTIGAASSRYRYRRSTLNSLGNSSLGLQQSMTETTGSLSSIPDSLMITEEEFQERLRQYELQQQEYDRYYQDHLPSGASYPSRSTISRTNSIPSLTSSNDPFKTFDSNEGLLDMDPFSDQKAESLSPSWSSLHR